MLRPPASRSLRASSFLPAAVECALHLHAPDDNGFDDAATPGKASRPLELLVPLKTVFDARLGRAAEARVAAALRFTEPFPAARFRTRSKVLDRDKARDLRYAGQQEAGNRYAHFVNEAHPGPGAPFGWAQSRFSQDELFAQLDGRRNRQALSEVDRWFRAIETGELTCAQ